ncbi:MAG: hypothetical protein ACRD12_08195 [Acidimicrobiales bacterium]
MPDTAQTFHDKDLVEAADDSLRGVPRGTPGVVVGVTGLTWIRYRVQFANGVERNLVDGSHLRRRNNG